MERDRKSHLSHSLDISSAFSDSKSPHFERPRHLAVFSTVKNVSVNQEDPKNETSGEAPLYTRSEPRHLLSQVLSDVPTLNRKELLEIPNLKQVSFDLNTGYGAQVEKDNRGTSFLNNLLECLLKEDLIGQADFVCWRGLLTKIAACPYEYSSKFDTGLIVVAQKVNNTIYLCEFPTDEAKYNVENQTDKQKLMTYWGMKFESYVSTLPNQPPQPDKCLNFNDEFSLLVSSRIGSIKIMFAGEVDCCFPNDTQRYIELKTTKAFEHAGHERSFKKFKLLKWWLQSYLIGIEDILCGFRNDDGIVHRCQWFKVSEMPKSANRDSNNWKPAVCLGFLEHFLRFVQKEVKEHSVPFVFHRKPKSSQFTVSTDKSGDFKFLPRWYVEAIRK